jgi:hypothetical protein
MEKLLYAFWRGSEAVELTRRRFIDELRPALVAAGADRVQFNIADFGDLAGTIDNFKLTATRPAPDGLVSFWLSSAFRRAPVERLLTSLFPRIAGYAVTESTVLRNVDHPSSDGERTWGFSQVTFLQLPPRLSFDEWRRIWFERHTQVAIDTQSTFRYVQDVVVQPLTADAPPFRGIVEECFPPAAMRDLAVL